MEYANALFSAATQAASSLAPRSTLSSSYTLHSALASSSASSSSAIAGPSAGTRFTRTLTIGAWRVDRAQHNTNGKQVSIWTCDKASLYPGGRESRRGDQNTQKRIERCIEVLKKEAASLSRLRHPCILEMAEPMEETRSTITFATEPVSASLRHAIAATTADSSAKRYSQNKDEDELELDEVEIQKGLGQLGKGLDFLHNSAKLVHSNLTPDAVIINNKGDWKLSGFGLSIYLFSAEGIAAKWEFPAYDHSIPSSLQRDYDYIAPEYILDETGPAPSNDMYSLGCLIHSIHTKTGPPFSHLNSLQNARTNMEEGLSRGMLRPQWRKLSEEAQSVLSQLLTRYPNSRLSAANFLTHNYFSSLLVSTLNFLARDSFASQTAEAQAGFLKGLVSVLPRFSDKVNRRKVLPSLLEETRKANLVPFLLPNILFIASKMDNDSFRSQVLPGLQPLFAIKDPPQAVITLLDNLPLFLEKCTPATFRDDVMPLVYVSLESENPIVLEKALKIVPGLSETLDYTTVKQTLFPKLTSLFARTTQLSVKVNCLIAFHSMIKILDKFILTERLVPLLAKIKTKEPSVMMSTLAVHEEMGKKAEIEAIATLILPQLWAMSIGPLLNANQFAKFMAVIKKLSQRVESEHSKHLAELKRLGETSNNNSTAGNDGRSAQIDFESLVRGKSNLSSKTEIAQDNLWADDQQNSSMTSGMTSPITPNLSPALSSQNNFDSAVRPAQNSRSNSTRLNSNLGARPIPANNFPSASFAAPPATNFQQHAQNSFPVARASLQPQIPNGLKSFAPLQPTAKQTPSAAVHQTFSSNYSSGQPNYNLNNTNSTAASAVTPAVFGMSSQPSYPTPPAANPWANQSTATPTANLPPGFSSGNVLQPKVMTPKSQPANSFGAWADFDPLK